MSVFDNRKYCKEHDCDYYEDHCPACVADFNEEVNSDIAGLAVDLIKIIKFDGHDRLLPEAAQVLIKEIERLKSKTYEDVTE